MGVQILQRYADKGETEGTSEAVELLQVARAQMKSIPAHLANYQKRLCLVLDSECCLDRLYGGFFSDWTCGGQWNRMLQYLQQLFMTCKKGGIQLTVAFNGALELQRLTEWNQRQQSNRQNVQMVLRHVQNKGTPPPKVWWVPPTCLSTALRLALLDLEIPMMCSMDDHHQEVLAYCRENNLHGIIGDDAEYLVFQPPRYFSASGLKLTYKGCIETKELFPGKLAEAFGLDARGLCILTTLLGNYLLTETQLAPLHMKLKINTVKDASEAIPILADYVKKLESRGSLEDLAAEIFGCEKNEKVVKQRQLFVESVQYYLNGTKEGFLKPRKLPKKKSVSPKREETTNGLAADSSNGEGNTDDLDISRFASETAENVAGSLEAYNQLAEQRHGSSQFLQREKDNEPNSHSNAPQVNGAGGGPVADENSPPTTGRDGEKENGRKKPAVPMEVIRTACERHQKGLMSPLIYQILTQKEIKLPILLEDDLQKDTPSVHQIYKPIRQNIYAILFNVHHQQYLAREVSDTPPPIPSVGEYSSPGTKPEMVKAEALTWAVPTVQRLWFGSNVEDVRRRMRVYLSCMNSDSPLMASTAYVPQQLLVMATVLRYLMQAKVPILRQLELDAFIVTAFCPDLMDSEYTQELQLPVVTPRGVYLATLFMQGVETAILANEACGAPIDFRMCYPWRFFDGKLFHNILAKTEFVKSLQELCNHRMEVLVKVERMRHAILENLHVQYARRNTNVPNSVLPFTPPGMLPSGFTPDPRRPQHPMRGNQRRQMSARGGQLEVAGVVVCSWGPNYNLARDRNHQQQQLNSAGRGYNCNFNNDRGGFNGRGGFNNRRRPNTGRRPKGKKSADRKPKPRTTDPTVVQLGQSGSSDEAASTGDEAPGQLNDQAAGDAEPNTSTC